MFRKRHPKDRSARRRGTTLVMSGVMMTMFLGFTALTVDVMVLSVARQQLGTTADAAALAGARELATPARFVGEPDMPALMANASERARFIATENRVLGDSAMVLANAQNTPDGDIVFGHIPIRNGNIFPAEFNPSAGLMPSFNAVQVRAARSQDRGGLVPNYFARVMGFNGSEVRVTSTAMAQLYDGAQGFQSTPGQNADLLPIVLEESIYTQMMASNTTDKYTWNPETNTITEGVPDGITESRLFPVESGNPGNWGTINVGVNNNSTNTIRDQIEYGITPQQLAQYPGSQITLSQTSPTTDRPSWTFEGNPGISAGMKSALEAIKGQPRFVPIYEATGGNGNNAWYRVIKFMPARIVDVNFQGNPKYVIIQPAVVQDPTTILDWENRTDDWSTGGVVRLHLVR
ncbi:hypothetical protein BH23PLA1_BH23PLA1_21500 [soil metagenome]